MCFVFITRTGIRAVATATTAAAFPLAKVHYPTHQKEGCDGNGKYHYDFLQHNQINRLPIWKNNVLTIQARPMV